MCACMHACMYVCMYRCMYIWICLYVCLNVCMYVWLPSHHLHTTCCTSSYLGWAISSPHYSGLPGPLCSFQSKRVSLCLLPFHTTYLLIPLLFPSPPQNPVREWSFSGCRSFLGLLNLPWPSYLSVTLGRTKINWLNNNWSYWKNLPVREKNLKILSSKLLMI